MGISLKSVIKGTAFAALMILFAVPALAQSTGTVSVTLKDASNGDPVGYATVSLTKSGASKPTKYVLSDGNGKAKLESVPNGTYTLKAELLGYKEYTHEVTVKGSNVDLGEVKMKVDSKTLDAANVSAVGNPIVMKKDTIEYNASSFKTTDNDMLEDLLKKLPGVEVSEDGSITANGETISKITIDGKTFFLDDPQLASKNIPSKIIEKVKVVQKKSEQAEFTGIDDGEEETIIDLSIQKGMMNGTFGNFLVGGGHDLPETEWSDGDWRYQGNGFVGRFTESNQLSLLFNGNNTNNRGFNDMVGSMMSGMRGGGGGMGQGSGGFGSSNGITRSWMAGLNGNTELFDDKMDLGGNYLFSGTRNDVEEQVDKITYLDDYNLNYSTDGYSTTKTNGHRFGIRMEHKFSEKTSIMFEPQVSFGNGSFHEISEFTTDTDTDGTIVHTNDGFNVSTGENDNVSTSGFFLFRQRLGIPGRTVSMNIDYSFSNNNMDGFNQSRTTTYDDAGEAVDSLVNQRYDQNEKSSSIGARVTYTEPLGKGFYIEANYRFQWSKNTSWKDTYDSDSFSSDSFLVGNYKNNFVGNGTLNDTYSNNIENRYINQDFGANLQYQKNNLRFQVGVGINPTDTKNETTRNGELQKYSSYVWNWAPRVMLMYDPDENTVLRIFYMGRSSQPSTSQLMPVPDNTDPLNVSFGNPYLTPYFTHNVNADMRYTNKDTFLSINGNVRFNYVKDPIVNATWYDSAGASYSIPVNGKDSYSGSFRLFINSPIARSNFSVFNMTNLSYSESSTYIGDSSFDTDKYYQDGEFDYDTFHADYPTLDGTDEFQRNDIQTLSATERLRLTFRNDAIEITAGGRTRVNKSWYTIASASTNWTWSNQVSGSINWTIPGGLTFASQLNYNWYRGYTTDQDDEIVMNAELQKLIFRNRVTLAVKGYDIFNQSKNLFVSDSSNYHTETHNNTLGRYIMVSFTYRFGTFGGNSSRRGGPGGRPGGMGGPPPGGGPGGPR